MHNLDVWLVMPFPLGSCWAEIFFASESGLAPQRIHLEQGRYQGVLPEVPVHLRLLPDAEQLLQLDADAKDAEFEEVEAAELYEPGISIPPDGILRRRIVLEHNCQCCYQSSGRFLGWEHALLAEYVGFGADKKPLIGGGLKKQFKSTDLLPIGAEQARYGEIIALAGDFYAYFDKKAFEEDKGQTWRPLIDSIKKSSLDYRLPALVDEKMIVLRSVLDTIRGHSESTEAARPLHQRVAGHLFYPVFRFLQLAAFNYCHFGAQPSDGNLRDERNEALKAYRYYHKRALDLVDQAHTLSEDKYQERLNEALALDAFGCHFLTDLFASGHIRVPRRRLGEEVGPLHGSLLRARRMHDEDNRLGLLCTTRIPLNPRWVWRAYGDGELKHDHAQEHRAIVQEAVRRSAAEILLRSFGAPDLLITERSEALIPRPLAAGAVPPKEDERYTPFKSPLIAANPTPNHYPRYAEIEVPGLATPILAERRKLGDLTLNEYVAIDGTPHGVFRLDGSRV